MARRDRFGRTVRVGCLAILLATGCAGTGTAGDAGVSASLGEADDATSAASSPGGSTTSPAVTTPADSSRSEGRRPPGSAGPRGDDAPPIVQGRVVDVVDGDTIDLADGTRVRLAIVDTPEVHGGLETCGPEASDFTGAFLAGHSVAVYRPADAPRTDAYGRTLGEVVRLTDGASLNVALVREGLARIDERYRDEDPDLAGRLRAAVADAARPSCASQPEPAAKAPVPATGAMAAETSAVHTGRLDGGWSCHPAYRQCLPQTRDLDCGGIRHRVAVIGQADPYRLDGATTSREDGVGCESYGPWSAASTYPYYL